MHIDDEKTLLILVGWATAIFVVVLSIVVFGCGGLKLPRTCVEIGASSDAGSDH